MIKATAGRIALGAALAAGPACDDPSAGKDAGQKEVVAEAAPEPLHLHNGFMPDPLIVEGSTTGVAAAASWDERCTGFVDPASPVVFVTDDAFAELRVIAWAAQDVTLVLRAPDGSYHCDDDSEGQYPILDTELRPGNHSIWVGTHEQGTSFDYRLGFSELDSVSVAALQR